MNENEFTIPASWRLTPKEFDVLTALVRASPKHLSKNDALDAIYPREADVDPKIIDVFVCKLRAKLATQGLGFVIETRWGKGHAIPPEAIERMREAAASPDGRAIRPPPVTGAAA
jgi:two-component system, cell cycle response regulator CtrA